MTRAKEHPTQPRRLGWRLTASFTAIVAAGIGVTPGTAHAGTGGTVQVTVEDAHAVPENGVCLEIIQPGKKNSADVVVTTTAPSGTDGTVGHITQANVGAGSYIARFTDCGATPGFAPFYYGATYNKAKAQVFGVVDDGVTNLGLQLLLASGSAGSIDGMLYDASNPGLGAPSVSVQAYSATKSALLQQTCTDQNGYYLLGELPDNIGGIKLDFGKSASCSNYRNFVAKWYGGTNYATATPVAIVPAGNATAADTTMALMTKPRVTVTSVTFAGDAANPIVTVTGSGFGTRAPGPNPKTRPCGEADVAGNGYDYANNVVLWDLNSDAQWQAGYPGDCIGINFVSYSATQIVFTLGDWYRDPQSLFGRQIASGDQFTVRIKGAPHAGIVGPIG